MRIPDKYYDLIMERDQLLEEEACILMHEPLNLEALYNVRLSLSKVESDLKLLEENVEVKFVVVSEMIELEHTESIFRNTKEFDNEESAKIYFREEVESIKRAFINKEELIEHEDIFHIKNKDEEINIMLYKVVE